jgi:immune inhibitor A
LGKYTTRITHYDGTPYPELYGKHPKLDGTTYWGATLGTGNPGDAGLQWGVKLELVKKSANNTTATFRFNAPAASP